MQTPDPSARTEYPSVLERIESLLVNIHLQPISIFSRKSIDLCSSRYRFHYKYDHVEQISSAIHFVQ